MDETELKRKIGETKRRLGDNLCILGHYYQRKEVIEFADHEGDSFTLAKAGADTKAKWIVFCGVRFMAEASVILAKPSQRVFMPAMNAGCPLSDMAGIEEVEAAWSALENAGVADEFIPIVYMNSSAELKAFCAVHGGLVCTSSSAARAFAWAVGQKKRIFFFPDENLGRNTAFKSGMDEKNIALWNPHEKNGGCDGKTLKSARVIVWKGFCHVHTFFTLEHVNAARAKYPGCKIIVHPECDPLVVKAADGEGSTSYLKEYAENAPPGSTIVIGTEINLVSRLAHKLTDKKIIPLARSLCPNMMRTSLVNLYFTLENLGEANEVLVPKHVAADARVALKRMLKV